MRSMTATKTRSEPDDATRVRSQPALTTSSGAIWLIVGALLAATGIAVLAPMTALALPAVAVTGILLIVACYVAMLAARLFVGPGRVRLGLMAGGMIGIALVALVCVGVITATEWNVLG